MKVSDKVFIEAVIIEKIEDFQGVHYKALISQYFGSGMMDTSKDIIINEKYNKIKL